MRKNPNEKERDDPSSDRGDELHPEALRLTLVEALDGDEAEKIVQGIIAFNTAKAGDFHNKPLAVFLRDREGKVRGGLLGRTAWGWLMITAFWVKAAFRMGGHGYQNARHDRRRGA
jgi:hypothetical protein